MTAAQLRRETGADAKARTLSPWSHLDNLLYAQHMRAIGLNYVRDALRLHSGLLATLRGAIISCSVLPSSTRPEKMTFGPCGSAREPGKKTCDGCQCPAMGERNANLNEAYRSIANHHR
jgi:hypothetical protein